MRRFVEDRSGAAVRWFALAALVLSLASVAGTRGLAWLSEPGRIAVVAYRALPAPADEGATGASAVDQASADPGIDRTPTGSIPSKALMIRIR